jgi:hypothetical protein
MGICFQTITAILLMHLFGIKQCSNAVGGQLSLSIPLPKKRKFHKPKINNKLLSHLQIIDDQQ